MVALSRSLRLAFPALALALLAGCASAPPKGARASGAFPQGLSVCAGGVSNAPAADASGRLAGFDQLIVVRGNMLARAPVEACLSSGYGPRRGAGGAGSFHHGLDLYTGAPKPVLAGGDGVIETAGQQRDYGNIVVIRHGAGVETRYAHLSSFAPGLRKGARVSAGDVIGMTGRTGNATAVHLHYEVRIDGRTLDPLTHGR